MKLSGASVCNGISRTSPMMSRRRKLYIHHRGPRPSNKEGGWLTRDMSVKDFYDDKKGPKLDETSPKVIAWMRSIMKRAEKQYQHEKNYASKESRKKGGNARG